MPMLYVNTDAITGSYPCLRKILGSMLIILTGIFSIRAMILNKTFDPPARTLHEASDTRH